MQYIVSKKALQKIGEFNKFCNEIKKYSLREMIHKYDLIGDILENCIVISLETDPMNLLGEINENYIEIIV